MACQDKFVRLPYVTLLVWLHLMGVGFAQDETWSGFVNAFGGRVDYLCPDNLALSGVASDFSSPVSNSGDRQWEFYCSSGNGLANVSVSCSLQAPINALQSDISFDCPSDGYLAGFVSDYTSASTDRVWQPYCCNRPFASVVNCQIPSANWENILRDNLNFTSPDGQVITGLQAFYFNRDRRWRFRTCDIQVNCGDPGVPSNAVRVGDNFLYNDIVMFTCNHGYYQSSGPVGGVRRCLETGLWSEEQPVCQLCTQISDCADIRCTNTTDHSCAECDSNNGPGLGERGFTNLGTQCQPKCSWLGTFCYPGLCPDVPMSCNCSERFQGAECLQISDSPDFQSCMVTLRGQDGSDLTSPCQPDTNRTTVYTNIEPHQLVAQWDVVYIAPSSLDLPARPAYVADFLVGVATSEIQATLYRASNPLQPVSMTIHPCEEFVISSDTPLSDVVSCSSTATPTNLSSHTFLHGDTFEVSAVASAGGYLDVRNLDTAQTQRHYYTATPSVHQTTFVIDLQPPTHCSLVSSTTCLPNQILLGLTGEIVSINNIAASWGGWLDVPSGITNYFIDVYYLEYSGGVLTEGARVKFTEYQHTGQTSYEDITSLPGEGPYSFVLQSHDLAGNVRFSRQALLYDFSSSIEINPLAPLTVVSAHPGTNYMWQNSTSDPIVVSGVGHFFNTNLRTTNYLAPLANYSLGGVSISEEYDQSFAQGRFPRGGTSNALGIVQLSYDVIVDREGGASAASLTQPNVFPFQTMDVGITGLELTPPTQDGDSVRIWFQAIDFRFQEVIDSTLVHIDSSRPILLELGLVWNGITGLDLHGTGTLLDLDIQFQTFDEHSGIYTIDWIIATLSDSQIVGSGQVPIFQIAPTSCLPPDCYCDPLNHCTPVGYSIRPISTDFTDSFEALHDTDYIVTITVTNHALLSSTLSHSFTVDTTPPLPGDVFDGTPGLGDNDFQTTFELSAWWVGFFDRETDIAFYQYIFDTQCANSSVFSYPLRPSSVVMETRITTATRNAPTNGTYFVTVVAYNQALQPSTPVCSDGVTIDTVPPEFMGVVIPGAVVDAGLVRDVTGEVWYVRADRVRVWVGSGVGVCLNRSTLLDDLSAYPIGYHQLPADVCVTSSSFTPSQTTYLTSDHTLNVSWIAEDYIGIREYRVGIISPANFTQDGSQVDYYQTARQSHYSFFDSQLLSNGNRFFLSVWALDLAQQEAIVNIGPILIDVTPPVFNGSLELVRQLDHVIVTWDDEAFSDDESGLTIESFAFAIGRTEYGTHVSPFRPLPPTTPPYCDTPFCVAIDTAVLTPSLLSGHEYYVTIKVTNRAGLSTYISTTPYEHVSSLPSLGYVYDINTAISFDILDSYNSVSEDIGVLVDSDSLGVRWGDFIHANLPVNYSIALGTQPGHDDVMKLTSVGMDTEFQYSNVTLRDGYMYYSTVVAENSYGAVNLSSNGVLVLKNLTQRLDLANVYDGLSPIDSDYQASKSAVSAMWEFPYAISNHLSHYEWGVFRINDGNLSDLELVQTFMNVGRQTWGTTSVSDLEEGSVYLSAVRACFPDQCLTSVLSDGFQISIPPVPSSVQAVYTPIDFDDQYGVSTYGNLELSWEQFVDPQIVSYEWSIGNGELGSELLVYWTREEWFDYRNPTNTFVTAPISLHKPNIVNVRGYNSAGFYSISSTPLKWNVDGEVLPQSSVPRSSLVVFDISESDVPPLLTDNWKEIEHHARVFTDIDYIGPVDQSSKVKLSAAWPDLRYKQYSYSVSSLQQISSCNADEPGVVACGVTIGNAVTVQDLELVDGERYYFCVQGLRSDAIHSTPDMPLTVTHCSNGVTVDLSPPLSGCVQIISPTLNDSDHMTGSGGEFPSGLRPILDNTIECTGNGTQFQVSKSEIFIVWNEFADVEVAGNSVHATGVAYYQYAIGTSPGAIDVTDFVNVGVATYAVARGLSLQSGITYYATIRAFDFVGQYANGFSQAVTVDTSPPIVKRVWIEGANDCFRSELNLMWDVPSDVESGIAGMEWGLGTRPGSSDVVEWNGVDVTLDVTGVSVDKTQFDDGQVLFLTLKVLNNAGLSMVTTSLAYTIDSSPPSPGLVYDGLPLGGRINDLDYKSDLSMLSSHWAGFTDPHTTVLEYFVAIGTESGGEDVQEKISVGMATSFTWIDLTLTHGLTYYTTVTACNDHGLCTSSSSNGITVDVTPPITGQVLNRYTGTEVQFQASRSTLSARWYGFHDDESTIQYYTYYIGLAPNDSSLAPPTRTPPTQTSFVIPAPFTLPTNRTIYTTVVAWNGANLRSQASSSGVYIDDTPPVVLSDVTIATDWAGSVDAVTQFSRSAVRVEWEFADILTSVDQHFWTILSDSGTQIPIPGKVVGVQGHATCTDLSMQDGESYRAMVVGCNQAGLCSQSISEPILVDSSPPIDGYFAVSTESTALLNRTVPGGMTWRNRNLRRYAELNIAFLGFSDPHSGISEYWVSVGTSYSSSDLSSSSQPSLIEPTLASQEVGVYSAFVDLNRLLATSEVVYISMWAVNGVGLKSRVVQGSFRVDPIPDRNNNGSLTILRSSTCPIDSCLGHCTCGPRGQLCSFGLPTPCEVLNATMLPPERQLLVRVVSPQLSVGANDSVLYTAVTDKLVGASQFVDQTSSEIQRLEWSVSEQGFPPGVGVMNTLNDGVWRETDNEMTAVFSVSKSRPLRHGVSYNFHVRAWYSNISYAVFTSNSITVDTVGPETVLGERVEEVENGRGLDFTSNSNTLAVSFDGVFSPSLSGGLATYLVAIGDSPGADNVVPFTSVQGPTSTFTGLNLQNGRMYFSTARANSPLGVITTSVSNGLVVDLMPPNVGHVFSGSVNHNVLGQNDTSSSSAHWVGFNDEVAGVNHYELALTNSTLPPVVQEYVNVGIALKYTLTSLSLTDRSVYFPHIVAVNNAGLRSADVTVSKGLVVDLSGPIGISNLPSESNLLVNPSFEGLSPATDSCPDSGNNGLATVGWQIANANLVVLTTSNVYNIVPYSGCNSVLFVGTVSQSLPTDPECWYRLSLLSHGYGASTYSSLEVSLPGVSILCQQSNPQRGWVSCDVIFKASDISSTLQLKTSSANNGIVIDNLRVVKLVEYSLARQGQLSVSSHGNSIPTVIGIGPEPFISQSKTRIHANWRIADPESEIKQFMWAIGTVPGGQQKQAYKSTGNLNWGISDMLGFSHGEELYVTVVASNFAGLSSIFYSQSFVVDLTPPTVNGSVYDGPGYDIEYQNTSVIWVDWTVAISDQESDLLSCRWAIGTSPGATDIQSYVTLPGNITSAHTNDLSPLLPHGTTVYSTVTCLNKAGLYATGYSSGVTILTTPPLSISASARISTPLFINYDIIDGYLPSNSLILTWSGFVEVSGAPLMYDIRVSNVSSVGVWERVGFANQLILNEIQLPLNESGHVIEVRAVNLAGVPSEGVANEIFVLSDPPLDTGTPVNATWVASTQIQLDWSSKFSSTASLRYELSLGTQMGSGSIRKWMGLSSLQTSLLISDPQLTRNNDYFLSLTAIGSSGLHTTVSQMISGIPISR